MGDERELPPDGKQRDLLFSCNLFIHLFSHFFLQALNFLFCIGVQPINNTVVVSGEQQRDSAIHICEFSRSVVSDSLRPHGL